MSAHNTESKMEWLHAMLQLVSGLVVVVPVVADASGRITMQTTLGLVTGRVVKDSNWSDVHVFTGIPYARPPLGILRFQPPQEAEPWEVPKDVTKLPNSCWQAIDHNFDRGPSVEMWNPNTQMSEDCLYLNLWVPNTPTRKPLLVWIYGGGFSSGTSTLRVYDGLKLASRNDVIVASFNYRIGPFGFLYGGTADSPGNVGLLDQVLALKWLKNNAANMGADAAKITLLGESAGAVSVGFHLLSPLSSELFTYAVLMSASPTADWAVQTLDRALNRTHTLACLLGCRSRTANETLTFLRSVSPALLADSQSNLTYLYFDLPFAPVVDGHFLPGQPLDLIASGKVKNTSIITGVVKDEGTYWLLYGFKDQYHQQDPHHMTSGQFSEVVGALLQPLGPEFNQVLIKEMTMRHYYDLRPPYARSYLDATDDICGDTIFKCPVVFFSELYSSQVKGQVFMYSFEHRVSSSSWPDWLGVAHGYEIEIFLGQPWLDPGHYQPEERTFSDDVMTRLVNFARTGNPNLDLPDSSVHWPEYTWSEQHYLIMNPANMGVSQGLRYSECQFWRSQVTLIQAANTRSLCASTSHAEERSRFPTAALFILSCILLWSYAC